MRRLLTSGLVLCMLACIAAGRDDNARAWGGKRHTERSPGGPLVTSGAQTRSNAAGNQSEELPLGSLFAVTEDRYEPHEPGCDSVSILSVMRPEPLRLGAQYVSPGRLTGNRDLSLIIAGGSNGLADPNNTGTELGEPGLYVTRCQSTNLATCEDTLLYTSPWIYDGGGIALSPDGYTLLVATDRGTSRVSKYDLRNVDWEKRWLGYEVNSYAFGPMSFDDRGLLIESTAIPAEIVFSGDGRVAHVLLQPDYYPGVAAVHSLDVASMKAIAPPVPVPVNHQGFDETRGPPPGSWRYFRGVRVSQATLSVDERLLVVNNWELGSITGVDLEARRSWQVPIPGFTPARTVLALDQHAVGGVAINRAYGPNQGLLAIHGIDRVGIYALTDDGRQLESRAMVTVTPQFVFRDRRAIGQWGGGTGPVGSIAWTGDGTHIVAAGAAEGPEEFRSWRVEGQGSILTARQGYETCSDRQNNLANDIFTPNGLLPTPTDEGTGERTPTATRTASATPTPSPSNTPESSRTPSPTASASAVSRRLWFPVVLSERCSDADRATKRFSVMLVIDASTSMGETAGDGTGRTKLMVAQQAIPVLVDALDLQGGDRVGLVTFNAEAVLAQPLTSERARIDAALARVTLAANSRLDLGIAAAADELMGPRRGIGHERVAVVLTDGRATGGPDSAIAEAQRAKAMGLTFFTIGLGGDADLLSLARIASRPEYSYAADSTPMLGGIFGLIGRLLPCPPHEFWSGR